MNARKNSALVVMAIVAVTLLACVFLPGCNTEAPVATKPSTVSVPTPQHASPTARTGETDAPLVDVPVAATGEFWVYKDKTGQWRWRYVAKNNKVVADSGESYFNRVDCVSGLQLIQKSTNAVVHDGLPPTEPVPDDKSKK